MTVQLDYLTFNASDWSGDIETALVFTMGDGESLIHFRDELFEAIQYDQKHDGETLFEACDLKHDGRKLVSAIKCDNDWLAHESDICREDKNPLVALLQVAANIL